MDVVRFGLSIRALRRRHRWTQARLGAEAGVSRAVVHRIERGGADRVTVRTLTRVVSVLGATLTVRAGWHGEGLDRLLDADHAALVEASVWLLVSNGWEVATEATFNVYGERGSIDVFATHATTGRLLVIEVKSVIPDVQATLLGIDRKARLARHVARDRGWTDGRTGGRTDGRRDALVSKLLVLPEDRTARRRIDRHAATFLTALPATNAEIRRWLKAPSGTIAGILFLTDAPQASARHRVASRPVERGA